MRMPFSYDKRCESWDALLGFTCCNDLTFSHGEPKRTGHHLRYRPLTLGADGLDDLSCLWCALPVGEPVSSASPITFERDDNAGGSVSGWTYRW